MNLFCASGFLLVTLAWRLGPHLVVHLQAGEHGVLKADVDPDHVVDQRVGFVGLQGRGDGQPGSCISVENVNQLLLLDGS